MLWKIAKAGRDQTVAFAAEELKKYIGRMDETQEVAVMCFDGFDPEIKNALWLGVCPEIAALVKEPDADDAVDIRVENGVGAIRGSNSRSVLIGVYRFLRELGCAWVRPGTDGEIIPKKCMDGVSVRLREIASYRHRGVCIEGAVNYDHVTNMIDWMPKVGMNGYFNQFNNPFTFYDRWYNHIGSTSWPKTPLTAAEIRGLRDQSLENLKKRGMMVHMAGHGWTCEPFGIPGESWDVRTYDITPEQKTVMAEVKGKRDLWGGIPLNTNLCYSNPKVRERIAEAVVDYCRRVPETDYLHLWLADGTNNHCECAECVKKRPADWYVTLLNEVDAHMTRANLSQKVVFLIYVDLLWNPVEAKLNHPERFVMMFAPITRTYSATMTDCEPFDEKRLPPYVRNQLSFPHSVGENLAWLRMWQRSFAGDSFDFDYHYMWDHFKDPGYYQMAQTLFRDMRDLHSVGLNGMVSCQNQRVWFPTGLGMTAMAAALWNENASFDAVADDYFLKAFGKEGYMARDYLKGLSEAFDPPYIRGEKPAHDAEKAREYRKIPEMVHAFLPVIGRNMADESLMENQRRSWRYLIAHGEMCIKLSAALAAHADDDAQTEKICAAELLSWVDEKEKALSDVFDGFEFRHVYGRNFAR